MVTLEGGGNREIPFLLPQPSGFLGVLIKGNFYLMLNDSV